MAWNSIGSLFYSGCQWLTTVLIVRLTTGYDAAGVLALAMAVVTAAFAVIMFWQNMRMREVFSDNRKKISGINAQLQDSLAGMRVVKSFANEETERFK